MELHREMRTIVWSIALSSILLIAACGSESACEGWDKPADLVGAHLKANEEFDGETLLSTVITEAEFKDFIALSGMDAETEKFALDNWNDSFKPRIEMLKLSVRMMENTPDAEKPGPDTLVYRPTDMKELPLTANMAIPGLRGPRAGKTFGDNPHFKWITVPEISNRTPEMSLLLASSKKSGCWKVVFVYRATEE